MDLTQPDQFACCWIVDFPFYEWNEDEKRVDFAHNPFSMPQGGLDALNSDADPLSLKAFQYDMVCNGYEIASGSIRNASPETMVRAFEITGLTKADVETQFGGMYRAFQFGAPPHGGMAAGVDRIVMLVCGVQNLREITLFPMNQQAQDLLMGAPSEATPQTTPRTRHPHPREAEGVAAGPPGSARLFHATPAGVILGQAEGATREPLLNAAKGPQQFPRRSNRDSRHKAENDTVGVAAFSAEFGGKPLFEFGGNSAPNSNPIKHLPPEFGGNSGPESAGEFAAV